MDNILIKLSEKSCIAFDSRSFMICDIIEDKNGNKSLRSKASFSSIFSLLHDVYLDTKCNAKLSFGKKQLGIIEELKILLKNRKKATIDNLPSFIRLEIKGDSYEFYQIIPEGKDKHMGYYTNQKGFERHIFHIHLKLQRFNSLLEFKEWLELKWKK